MGLPLSRRDTAAIIVFAGTHAAQNGQYYSIKGTTVGELQQVYQELFYIYGTLMQQPAQITFLPNPSGIATGGTLPPAGAFPINSQNDEVLDAAIAAAGVQLVLLNTTVQAITVDDLNNSIAQKERTATSYNIGRLPMPDLSIFGLNQLKGLCQTLVAQIMAVIASGEDE